MRFLHKPMDRTPQSDLMGFEDQLARGFRRLTLMDDTNLIEAAREFITSGTGEPSLTQALLHSVLWNNEETRRRDIGTSSALFQFSERIST